MRSSKRKGDTYIPNAPFVDWLRQQIRDLGEDPDHPPVNHLFGTSARDRLARRLDITTRTLYRHLNYLNGCSNPTSVISRMAVEDMLHHAGVSFYAMYPDFADAEDVALEPDEFCRQCGEWTTPIESRCPWCESLVGVWAA